MPASEVIQASQEAREAGGALTEVRIDPPHVMHRPDAGLEAVAEIAATEPAPFPAEEESPEVLEQVRLHARQLAEHLQARQREHDHREAQLNASLAELDHEQRKARLWFSERQQELFERQAEMDRRAAELEERQSRLSAAEQFHEDARQAAENQTRQREEDLQRREEQLAAVSQRLAQARQAQQDAARDWSTQREQEELSLARGRQEVDTRREASLELVRLLLAGVKRQRMALELQVEQLAERERHTEQATAAVALRGAQLDQAEALLAQQQGEVQGERQRLVEERARLQQQAAAERERLAEQEHRAAAELAKQQQALRQRGEQLDEHRAALQRRIDEARRLRQETLEMRLALEAAQAQVSGLLPEAGLTLSLSQQRAKLSDHYRLASLELAERKEELEAVRARLAEHHRKTVAQRQELQDWAARRQAEIEAQAAHLAAREQELSCQQEQFERLQHSWQQERQSHQQEVQCLLAQLRLEDALAA